MEKQLDNLTLDDGDEEEMTFEQVLVYSARVNDLDEVKEMCEVRNPPIDINYRDDRYSRNTALHMAAANGHTAIVALLLS